MSSQSASQNDVKELIRVMHGDAGVTYVTNKKRGGDSGRKGPRYEDFFFVYKAAEIAVTYIAQPRPWPAVRGQVLGYVDDVVVLTRTQSDYYQLKNVASITWTSGDHPLEADFANQYTIAQALGLPRPLTHLVVPDADLKAKMVAAMPQTISAHSSVVHFPYSDGSLNRLVLECTHLQELLKTLSKRREPTLDEIEGVYGVLTMSLLQHPDGAEVDVLLDSANKRLPNLLRSLNVVDEKQFVISNFENTLAAIPGLTYSFDKGFFSWSAFGMSGIFSTDCASAEFARFQANVVQNQPPTFDDFEGLLP
jgi:hypothetical protein